MVRVATAICVLPVIAFVVAATMYPALYARHVQIVAAGMPVQLRVGIAAAIVAVPLSVIGALAFLLWGRVRGRIGWVDAAAIGMIVGNFPLLYFTMLASAHGTSTITEWRDVWTRGRSPIVMGSLLGFVCASVFWGIARRSLRSQAWLLAHSMIHSNPFDARGQHQPLSEIGL